MHRVRVWISVIVVLCFAAGAAAQTASVSGRVVDTQNMPVVGAVVTLSSSAGCRVDTRTGQDGGFAFDQLAPGSFTLRVEATMLATWTQNVTAAANGAPLTITLQIAGLNEAISVVGTAPSTLSTPTVT